MKVQAPAKLNLFLHVLGRRPDGYHELQTLFQLIDLYDTLTFTDRRDGRIVRTGGLPGLDPTDDLVVRAAHALRLSAGIPARGVTIDVEKHIPAGGGLGGGSSDAAATLLVLNRLWHLDWTLDRLAALGATLGADVPVFIRGESALAEGIGERLSPVDLPERWYLVVDPGVEVSTAALFQAPELTRDSPRLTIPDFVSGGGRNDFEPVARARHAEVGAVLDWLDDHGGGRLTGTGGCCFAHYATREEAEAAARALPDRWRGFVARGLDRSPLFGA